MLNKLRRITRDGRWIPEIDSLRFIAITSVFMFHLHGELSQNLRHHAVIESRYSFLSYLLVNADRGVRLFFVISGFILGLPFARQRLLNGNTVSLGKYYLRRLTRLEPPYILSFLIAITLYGIYTHGLGITGNYFKHVIAGVLYSNNLIYRDMNPVNCVTWSLEVEIQFYILAPFLAYLFCIKNTITRRGTMLALILLIGIAQKAFFPICTVGQFPNSVIGQFLISYYIQYFIAGFLLSDIYIMHLEGRSTIWWDAVALIGWITYFTVPSSPIAHMLFPFLLLLLCASALCCQKFKFIFSNTTIAVIGGMCYSIYLLHYLLIAAFYTVTNRLIVSGDYLTSYVIQLVFLGVPVFLLCAVFYIWIERYFMDPGWLARLRFRFIKNK